MATPQPATSRRPKLTLSIKPSNPTPKTSRTLHTTTPGSPTAFNTLSNVYVTAIERSTPVTAINTHHPGPPRLQLNTDLFKQNQAKIHTPHVQCPETPLSANPASPVHMELAFPTILTSTPPLSAGPFDADEAPKFSFAGPDGNALSMPSHHTQPEPRTPRRRMMLSSLTAPGSTPPYTHPRTLHSILRNSPLPPSSSITPTSVRRQSLRLQEKAARRVAYNSPIEQTITTTAWYSEASPLSPASLVHDTDASLDHALDYTGDEIRDGGQTPGPFEDMRRRMAGLVASSPLSPTGSGGIRKRKKKEKKRRWVWTIGQDDAEEDNDDVGGAVAAVRAARARAASEPPPLLIVPPSQTQEQDLPTPSVESFDESMDVPMLDSSDVAAGERSLTPGEMEVDASTPTSARKGLNGETAARSDRLGSEGLFNAETGSRRDTPVPPDMMMA